MEQNRTEENEEVVEREPTEEEKKRCEEDANRHANDPAELQQEEEPMTYDEWLVNRADEEEYYAETPEEKTQREQDEEALGIRESEPDKNDPETQQDLTQQNEEHEAEQCTEENTTTTEETTDSTHTDTVEPPPEEEQEEVKVLDLRKPEDCDKYIEDTNFLELFQLVISKQQTEDTNFEGLTDADPKFIHTVGLYLISAMAKRFKIQLEASLSLVEFELSDYVNNKVTGMGLNMWWIGFGKPRKARKTTMLKYLKQMVRGAMQTMTFTPHIMGDEFSPEAFISQASGSQFLVSVDESNTIEANSKRKSKSKEEQKQVFRDMCSHLMWVQDEVLRIFIEMKDQRSNMRNFMSVLSQLWDGSTYTRVTKSGNVEAIVDPYFTMFITSTETLPQAFDRKDFQQGGMNRPIYIAIENGAGAKVQDEEDGEEENVKQ